MKLKCIIWMFYFLISEKITCDSTTSVPLTIEVTTTEFTAETETENSPTTEPITEYPRTPATWGLRGFYGGSYYNNLIDNPNNIHYIHGAFQVPTQFYYAHNQYRYGPGAETFDVYLGFGISKMSDKNFKYTDFHHYYHDINRNITDNDTIQSDNIIGCHQSALFMCPENTETVCLMNGTIYCMSKVTAVTPCTEDDTLSCINTTVPCVRMCSAENNYLEEISLQCLATIVIEDVYEDRKGMTINRVGNSFVLVPALKLQEKTFCVSVIVDPQPEQPLNSK